MMSLSSSLVMVKPTTVATTTTATATKTTFGVHRSSFRRSSSSFTSFLNSNINNKKKNFKVKTTKSILTGPSNSISNNSSNNYNPFFGPASYRSSFCLLRKLMFLCLHLPAGFLVEMMTFSVKL